MRQAWLIINSCLVDPTDLLAALRADAVPPGLIVIEGQCDLVPIASACAAPIGKSLFLHICALVWPTSPGSWSPTGASLSRGRLFGSVLRGPK